LRAGGINPLDVAKHTLPMVGLSLVAGAGEIRESVKDTVLKTVMPDAQ
jgi:hypothetical protein